MLDIRMIREEAQAVGERLRTKVADAEVGDVLAADRRRRDLLAEVESLKNQRNVASKELGKKKKGGEDISGEQATLRELGDRIKEMDQSLRELEVTLEDALLRLPNLPHESAPVGSSEGDNVLIRTWGSPPGFDFQPKPHWEIGEALGILDFERSAKMAGSGFYTLIGEGARLQRALIRFMLDIHSREHGYLEVACFRREAGAAGRDTRGMVRVHQFDKVELVKFVEPSTSYSELESLVVDAEDILQRLGLCYRVVELCTSDLSFAAAKCYDIELWAAAQQRWLEVSSCSNFADFQARRANIRCRDSDGKRQFVHTLNGSGVALPRLVVAILENGQQEDGSVEIPEAIRHYMDGQARIG